jgi:hypothetical protein
MTILELEKNLWERVDNVVRCGYIRDMETNTDIYFVIRMATGNKAHLRKDGSSQTECATWTGYTRQFKTEETVITCTKCWRAVNRTYAGIDAMAAQGFTKEIK